MPERSEEKEIKYRLVSNVVSVVMEKEEAQVVVVVILMT